MNGNVTLRDFRDSDAEALNRVASKAFDQFKENYSDWPALLRGISAMSDLSVNGEIIVAEVDDHMVGGVAYIPPDKPKAAFFEQSWPVMRMLVVDPAARGLGIGKTLTLECIRRARRDNSAVIALHTTPIMSVVLPMYLRMGFSFLCDAPEIYGAPYAVYTMNLDDV